MVKLQVVMADNPPRREVGTGFHRPRPQPTSWLFLGEQLHALDHHLPAPTQPGCRLLTPQNWGSCGPTPALRPRIEPEGDEDGEV